MPFSERFYQFLDLFLGPVRDTTVVGQEDLAKVEAADGPLEVEVIGVEEAEDLVAEDHLILGNPSNRL